MCQTDGQHETLIYNIWLMVGQTISNGDADKANRPEAHLVNLSGVQEGARENGLNGLAMIV